MRRLFMLALFFGSISPSFGDVVEREVREWYEVRQSGNMPLLNALNAATPIREGGKIFHGHTAWEINWNFRWNSSGSGLCEITAVKTDLSIKMKLPRLVASSPEVAREFDRYFPALLTHEQGHKSLAVDAANQVDRSIRNLRPMASCQALQAEANRIGMAILESAKVRELEYDATTKHGCAQGACLAR